MFSKLLVLTDGQCSKPRDVLINFCRVKISVHSCWTPTPRTVSDIQRQIERSRLLFRRFHCFLPSCHDIYSPNHSVVLILQLCVLTRRGRGAGARVSLAPELLLLEERSTVGTCRADSSPTLHTHTHSGGILCFRVTGGKNQESWWKGNEEGIGKDSRAREAAGLLMSNQYHRNC